MTVINLNSRRTTPSPVLAAEEGRRVEDLVTEDWREAVLGCAKGEHKPSRRVTFPGGWQVTTCGCGSRCFPSVGQGGPKI